MPEVEREAILYERAQKRLAKIERKRLEEKMKLLEEVSRPSRGPSLSLEKKRKTLEELRARRERRKKRDSDSDYYEEGEVSKPAVQETSRAQGNNEGIVFSPSDQLIDLEGANSIRLSRDFLAKWIFHPRFEDIARGCLLRLAIGVRNGEQVYRLVEVRKIVKYHRTYQLNNMMTDKAALLKYGSQERTFRLDVVSNSDFTESEFKRWMQVLQEERQSIMIKKQVALHRKKLDDLESQPISEEVVSAMLAARKELGMSHRNFITERTALLNLREEALASGNSFEVERIDEELHQLQKESRQAPSLSQKSHVKSSAISRLNQKNRLTNTSSSMAPKTTILNVSKSNIEHDPFSRRRCQPSNFDALFDVNKFTHEDEDSKQEHDVFPAEEEPSGPIDLFSAHDVDLELDL